MDTGSLPIQVWPFYEAPVEYQNLSEHGGDKDWIALVPKKYLSNPDPYYRLFRLLESPPFGNDISEHVLENGDIVYISAH